MNYLSAFSVARELPLENFHPPLSPFFSLFHYANNSETIDKEFVTIKYTLVVLVRLTNPLSVFTHLEKTVSAQRAEADEGASFTTRRPARRIDFCSIILLETRPEPCYVCAFIKVHSTARLFRRGQSRRVDPFGEATAIAAWTTITHREEERKREMGASEGEGGRTYNIHRLKIHH